MRRVRFVLVAAIVMTASMADAGHRATSHAPAKAACAKTTKAARAKTTKAPRTKAKLEPAKSIVTDAALDDAKPLPIPATALLTQYQRVGRDLLLLSNERRAQVGVETEDAKLSCAELQAMFRAININEAVKTPEARVVAAATLADLHRKIERLRGVALSQDCLNNPLAAECT